MKKTIILSVLIIGFVQLFGQETKDSTILDKAINFKLFQNDDVSIDLKFIDPTKGYFGIDYDLYLTRNLSKFGKDLMKSINLELSSKGYLTVRGEDNTNNSLVSQLRVSGFPLLKINAKKITSSAPHWSHFIDDVDDDRIINESRKRAEQVSSPFWLFGDLHGKHETTQDFKSYDLAFGANISISSSYLTSILDFPFGILRTEANNNPRQFDLSVGYDYVVGIEHTELYNLKDSSSYMNRLNIKAEWETGIFTGKDRLIFLFDTYYDLDATKSQIEAGKDWNYFFMVKLERSLNFNPKTGTLTKVAIKYTKGSLPPNFTEGYVLGGGFSIEF